MELIIKLLKNKNIDGKNLEKIVNLKAQHWKYPKSEQIKWIKENLEDNDYHLMILNNGNDNLIAYLNMVSVEIQTNGLNYELLGIGNVCVDINQKNKGYGLLLMNVANFLLNDMNQVGILLCKEHLVPFYERAGWFSYHGKAIINTEIYQNYILFSKKVNFSSIQINRNF